MSLQPGHSTPNALYFGIDSSCNYSNGLAVAGTATSVPFAIADTSVVKLRFNYFLVTEHNSTFDKASIQVSVNGGAFAIVASNNQGGVSLQQTTAWTAGVVDLAPLVAGLSAPSVQLRVAFDSIDSILNSTDRIPRRRHQGGWSGGRRRIRRPSSPPVRIRRLRCRRGDAQRVGDRRRVAGAAGVSTRGASSAGRAR